MGLILTRMILIVDVAPPANVVTLAVARRTTTRSATTVAVGQTKNWGKYVFYAKRCVCCWNKDVTVVLRINSLKLLTFPSFVSKLRHTYPCNVSSH
ncbi:unnamed protein product [Arabidopsis thaliana]|uniref:Secreted protein n=1 Tax=Arabidopsis thaliana TaxID=3702 RepID=A0A5S9YH07_ARATH|nr:unnamed protein product [Arabidopsis thaliana]